MWLTVRRWAKAWWDTLHFWWAWLRDSKVGDAWRCKVMGRHQTKMDSNGCCYRCGEPTDDYY